MAMPPNRVMARCRQGKPPFGAYVRIPAPQVGEREAARPNRIRHEPANDYYA